MKKTILFAAVLALAAMPMLSCGSSSSSAEQAPATEAEQAAAPETEQAPSAEKGKHAVVTVNDDNKFRPNMKVSKVTVLDFNATWCVPCKKLTPAYDQVAEKMGDKVEFYTIDIDKNPQTAQAFRVSSIPTVVILTPEGKISSFTGLGELGLTSNVAPDDVTAVLADNLSKAIINALK